MNKYMKSECPYCNEEIIGQKVHASCVYDDIYDTIMSGNKLKPIQYTRAKNKGLDIAEIRIHVLEDMKGVIKDD